MLGITKFSLEKGVRGIFECKIEEIY